MTSPPLPPAPDDPGSVEVAPPRKKSLLEKVTAGVLYSLPVVFLLIILGLVLFGIFSGPVTQDYSQKPTAAVPTTQVVTAAEVQDHVDAVVKMLPRDLDKANQMAASFVGHIEARGCAAMGTSGLAVSARAAGAELDAWIPQAKAVPEGFGPPAIGAATGPWPDTESPRDVVFIAVAVTCKT